jgi:hypothetical protein
VDADISEFSVKWAVGQGVVVAVAAEAEMKPLKNGHMLEGSALFAFDNGTKHVFRLPAAGQTEGTILTPTQPVLITSGSKPTLLSTKSQSFVCVLLRDLKGQLSVVVHKAVIVPVGTQFRLSSKPISVSNLKQLKNDVDTIRKLAARPHRL